MSEANSRLPLHVARGGVMLLLSFSAATVYLAPLLMPAGYSWVSNVISESAAQGVRGAWLARVGLLTFGFAVLWQASLLRGVWSSGTYRFHLAFAVFMLCAAAFSHRPWIASLPFDAFEDLLHSVAATAMGFAFAFGVAFRQWQRIREKNVTRVLDLLAIAASVLLPLAGSYWSEVSGLLQRTMFLIAYVWYAREILHLPAA